MHGMYCIVERISSACFICRPGSEGVVIYCDNTFLRWAPRAENEYSYRT